MSQSVLAAQLYTLRNFTKTPEAIAHTMHKVKQIGYGVVQLSALGPIDPQALKQILDDEGLTVCATHVPYDRLQNDLAAIIDEHHLWGCPNVAIGGLPQAYRNYEGYLRFAEEASAIARDLAAANLTFSYHNHSFELEKFDGQTALELLYTKSDPAVFFAEIDTYWLQHGGADPAVWIRSVKDRIPLVHLKDMAVMNNTSIMAEVGEGNMNWDSILAACAEANVEWYIVEQDECQRDPFESLAISLRNLQGMGLS